MQNQLSAETLSNAGYYFSELAKVLQELNDADRRRLCSLLVATVARHSLPAVADLAGAAVFTITLGGAR